MLKTVLVPVTATKADAPALSAAAQIARTCGAHLDALHVRIDPTDAVFGMSADGMGGAMVPSLIDDLERQGDARESSARKAFDDYAARSSDGVVPSAALSATMHVETGDEMRFLARYAITADLVVAARGEEPAEMRSVFEGILMDGCRPLLMPGDGAASPPEFERVVIAWKETPQTGRAVSAALPFLARAKQITVITVMEDGATPAEDTGRLLQYLGWHGLRADVECVYPAGHEPVDALRRAVENSAGLLVMGAYGHSRAREWLFGGFTQAMLSKAPFAVLMAH